MASSLWDDPEIKKTIDLMDSKTRYQYSKIGEYLFGGNGAYSQITNTTKTDPTSSLFESAAQLELLLRDGLDPADLSDDEKFVLSKIYGKSGVMDKFGIDVEEIPDENDLNYILNLQNEQTDCRRVPGDNGENQGAEKSDERAEGRGKDDNSGTTRLSEPNGRRGYKNRRKYRNYADKQRQENK
jgi:hypothetical protein